MHSKLAIVRRRAPLVALCHSRSLLRVMLPLIMIGRKVAKGVHRKVKGDEIASPEEEALQKKLNKLHKEVSKHPEDTAKHIQAVETEISLETIREQRLLRIGHADEAEQCKQRLAHLQQQMAQLQQQQQQGQQPNPQQQGQPVQQQPPLQMQAAPAMQYAAPPPAYIQQATTVPAAQTMISQ